MRTITGTLIGLVLSASSMANVGHVSLVGRSPSSINVTFTLKTAGQQTANGVDTDPENLAIFNQIFSPAATTSALTFLSISGHTCALPIGFKNSASNYYAEFSSSNCHMVKA